MTNSLKEFGITVSEADRLNQLSSQERIRELRQGLEAYTNEVLADKPVSTLYHYWTDSTGNFFTAPPKNNDSFEEIYNINHQFDPQERANLPKEGFAKVRNLLIKNPNSVVLWYSPPGQASFDTETNNPYNEIHYDYGQLYVHYFDGKKVNAVAVKVSAPDTLSLWIPQLKQPQTQSSKEIAESLLTPLVFNGSIDTFIEQTPQSNQTLYTDKKGVNHSLVSVLNDMRNTFANIKTDQLIDFDGALNHLPQDELTEQKILTIYLETIQRYQQATGNMIINLSGSCGGSIVTPFNIDQILLELSKIPNLPSINQLLNPVGSESRVLNASKTLECTCPFCKEKVQAKIHNDRISCPHCHKEAPYAC